MGVMTGHRMKNALQRQGTGSFIVRSALRWMCRSSRLRFGSNYIDVIRGCLVIRLANRHPPYAPDMAKRFDHYFTHVEPIAEGERLVWTTLGRGCIAAAEHMWNLSSLRSPKRLTRWTITSAATRPSWVTRFSISMRTAACRLIDFRRLVGPSGRATAFEPDPLNFELLERNLARHALTNVSLLFVAVADFTGTAEFFRGGRFWARRL